MTTVRKARERLIRRWIELGDRERGDVPGWVLITLMTAGIVTALWQFAQPALKGLFENAITSVNGG